MSFVVPNMSVLQTRALREDAKRIVATVDLGRQRAVVTRIPHRMFIDIKNATYGLEWLAPVEDEAPQSGLNASGFEISAPLSLAPPPAAEREFVPTPGHIGRLASLSDGIGFAEIETSGGRIHAGEIYVDFQRDGTSSFTVIVIDDPDGQKLFLEILPLADTVRIQDEEF